MNISDIAKLSGVSRSTVSRYLNDGEVSKDTAEKIKKIIDEHNYIPNKNARKIKGKSNEVMVIVESIKLPSSAQFLDELHKECQNHNLIPVIYTSSFDKKKELNLIRSAVQERYLAVVVFSNNDYSTKIEGIGDLNLIVVGQKSSAYPSLYYDGKDFFEQLTMKIGLKNKKQLNKIVAVGADISDKEFEGRVKGVKEAAKMLEVQFENFNVDIQSDEPIIPSEYTDRTYFACISDSIALRLMEGLENRVVGQDYILSGLGAYSATRYLKLSTIEIDYSQIAKEVILEIKSQMKKSTKISLNFIERDSTMFR